MRAANVAGRSRRKKATTTATTRPAALNGTSCVYVADFVPLSCADDYTLVEESCIRYEDPITELGCPERSVEDSDGNCRQPVADLPHFSCENPARDPVG